jgi:hypothetical protein
MTGLTKASEMSQSRPPNFGPKIEPETSEYESDISFNSYVGACNVSVCKASLVLELGCASRGGESIGKMINCISHTVTV